MYRKIFHPIKKINRLLFRLTLICYKLVKIGTEELSKLIRYLSNIVEKEKEKVFRTKTGFCHIFPDRIVLTRDGIVGNLSEITVSNSISRILTIYTLLLVGLLYFAFNAYSSGQTLRAIAFALVSVYLTFGIFNSLNNSANPVIEREKIKSVKFKKAIIGITRSRFEVYFEDVNKRLKKRLIMLPGSMSDGSNETEKALKIFEDEKLITTR